MDHFVRVIAKLSGGRLRNAAKHKEEKQKNSQENENRIPMKIFTNNLTHLNKRNVIRK